MSVQPNCIGYRRLHHHRRRCRAVAELFVDLVDVYVYVFHVLTVAAFVLSLWYLADRHLASWPGMQLMLTEIGVSWMHRDHVREHAPMGAMSMTQMLSWLEWMYLVARFVRCAVEWHVSMR
jgi:hypothetical protein